MEKLSPRIAKKHNDCFEIIKFFNGRKFPPIYLSAFPLINLSSQKFLQQHTKSQLISLDGFHRLLSLLYPISIDFDFIESYNAVNDENFTIN